MKSVILGINPNAKIIDLAHDIEPQNLPQASLYLQSSLKFIPENSIILAIIDPEVGSKRKILYLRTDRHDIICPDNGMVNQINSSFPFRKIISVNYKSFLNSPISDTFHGRDIFAPLAATLSLQNQFIPPGDEMIYSELEPNIYPNPIVANNSIQGEVIFIDRFGNLVTNISHDLIKATTNQYKMIEIKFADITINGINKHYSEVNPYNIIAYIGSMTNLEIGTFKDNLARNHNITAGEKVFLQHI